MNETINKKPNRKIDWEAVKLQYYKSDIMEAKVFIENIGMKYNGNTKIKTKGWQEDKAIFMENINKKASKEVEQSLIEQRAILLTNMEKAKIAGLQELAMRLTKNHKSMNVWTIGSIVTIFNNEQELDGDKVDNTTSVLSLRQKIKQAQLKNNPKGGKV